MAFPSITPLITSQIDQRPDVVSATTQNGRPWVRQYSTTRKFTLKNLKYLLTSAEWDLLISDYQINRSTAFSWDDERFSPAISRTVYYTARPSRQKIKPNLYFVSVSLIEQ